MHLLHPIPQNCHIGVYSTWRPNLHKYWFPWQLNASGASGQIRAASPTTTQCNREFSLIQEFLELPLFPWWSVLLVEFSGVREQTLLWPLQPLPGSLSQRWRMVL